MKTYSVKEIADLLKTNPETVRRWIRTGKLRAVQQSRKDGNVVTEQSLNDFLKSSPKYQSIALTAGIASGLLGGISGGVVTATFIATLLARMSLKEMEEINNSQIPISEVEKFIAESIDKSEKIIVKKKKEIKDIEQEIIDEEKRVIELKKFLDEIHSTSTETADN